MNIHGFPCIVTANLNRYLTQLDEDEREIENDHSATQPMFKRLYPGTNGITLEADEMILHWSNGRTRRHQACERI